MSDLTRRQRIRAAKEQALSAVSAHGSSDELGALTFWDLNMGFRASCDAVAEMYRAHDLDPVTDLPEPTDYSVAFGRAVESVRSAVRSLGYTLLDAAKGANGERRIAVVRIERNGRVTTDDEGTIVCPQGGKVAPFIERDDPAGIGKQVYEKCKDLHEVYTTDDIRTSVTTLLLRYAAMPCRERPSVVYFLPPGGMRALEKLDNTLQELGAGSISQFRGYRKDPSSVKAVVQAVNKGIEDRLREFAEQAEQYAKANGTRESTIQKRLEDAKHLKQQAELYRTILGAAVQSVEERIASVETTLRQSLTA